jgi:HAE1 family hydrophobic/amphiphilic exporter-1
LGLYAQSIANQLRAAYQGSKVVESTVSLEMYEVIVTLDDDSKDELSDFDNFPVIHPLDGSVVPLSHVAEIVPTRGFSRIHRINNQRTVSVW